MNFILTDSQGNEQYLIFACLILAVFRIYLEVIGFNFMSLPLTQRLGQKGATSVHQMGFYLSVGYLLLFGPQFFLT